MSESEDILSDTKSDNSDNVNLIEVQLISKFNIFNEKNTRLFILPKKTLLFDLENQIAKISIDYPYKRQYITYVSNNSKDRLLSSCKLFNGLKLFLEPIKIVVVFNYGNIQGLAGEFFHFNTILDIKKGIYNLLNKYKKMVLDISKMKLYLDDIDMFIDYELANDKKLYEYDYVNLNDDEYWKKIIMVYNDQ